MTDPRKIYLVVSGSYSDYRVSCAFTERDHAIAYAAAMNNLTPDEQRQLLELDGLFHTKLLKRLDALPAHVRKVHVQDGYTVEEYDLYDHIPVADLPPSE